MLKRVCRGSSGSELDKFLTHLWVQGIQLNSNEGQHLLPRGDNYEIGKIH